ncbi:NAD(P)-binding protein [Massarina eburnea CBS 473.64]|uniref:NAD(P)-binding protein n=1 Tax=Massarina eburnea CBS 473.64 TaxID=1395130 RepID=A0A6A6RQR4_9PLEO|nr:NAD(P)-binding protein [Massarina eburnea CBS 473.64]
MGTAPFPSPTATWHDNIYPSITPTRPELSAKGKTIVITGGGTGIGAATAHHFAEAGASKIAIFGRREQPLLDTKASIEEKFPQVQVFAASADVTNKAQVDSAFAKVGKIHVMVSNAGFAGPLEGMNDVDPEKFLATIHQNVAGAVYVSQAFMRHAAEDAVAIDVNSSAMHMNFGPYCAAYNVSKMATYRTWDCVGVANPQMRIFHIQPGVVNTDMNKEVGGVAAFGFEDHPSLPAGFSVWLASPEARFLKGKLLWANWDVDELKARATELEGSQELNIDLVGWPFGRPDWADAFKDLKL